MDLLPELALSFTLTDALLVLAVSLGLSALIAWVYQRTHASAPYPSGLARTMILTGIASQDDLKINGGTIIVTAANDGIKGRDSLAVLAGDISVTAGADGLQANNDEEAEEGYIVIEGGTLTITSGGGSDAHTGTDSAKGLKAGAAITISGGAITIARAYEGLESADIRLNGGNVRITAADDGVNVAGGTDGSGMGGGRPGQDQFAAAGL